MLKVLHNLMGRHLRCPMFEFTMCSLTIKSLSLCCTPLNCMHVQKTQKITSLNSNKRFVLVAK